MSTKKLITKIFPRSKSKSTYSIASSAGSDDDRAKKKKRSLREKVQNVKPKIPKGVIRKKKSDTNAKDSRGLTRLHVATLEGNVEGVRDLLSKKDVDINAEDRRHRTPLIVACENNNTDIALKLIKNNADLTVWEENFDTPLHIALRKCNKTISDKIVEKASTKGQLRALMAEPNWNWVAPIHEATKSGYKDIIKRSLDEDLKWESLDETEGEDVSVLELRGENDDTILHIASSHGHIEIVELLVERGARLESRNLNHSTPLHLACIGNHRHVAEFLIEKKADINAKDADGFTPLQVAANAESFDVIIALLDHYQKAADGESSSSIKTDDHDTMTIASDEKSLNELQEGNILEAIAEDDEEVANDEEHDVSTKGKGEVIGAGDNEGKDESNESDKKGNDQNSTPSAKDEESVAIDIEGDDTPTKIDPKAPLENSEVKTDAGTEHTDAAVTGSVWNVSEAGAVTNVEGGTHETPKKATPEEITEFVDWVVMEDKARVFKLLMRYRSKLNGLTEDDLRKYMNHASKHGHADTVAVLIRWRPELVDSRDDQGMYPLHHAADQGHDSAVQELLRANAAVNAVTVDQENVEGNADDSSAVGETRASGKADGRTPLHYAAQNGWTRAAQSLLRAGADINFRDSNEVTPLHLASSNNQLDVVKLFLDHHVDILIRDQQGLNALDYAIDSGHENAANLLLSHADWMQLLSSCSWDEDMKVRSTPMKKLIEKMPDVAQGVMDKCITASSLGDYKDNDFWIEFYYEFLEDSFSLWRKPEYSQPEQQDMIKESEDANQNNNNDNDDEKRNNDANRTDGGAPNDADHGAHRDENNAADAQSAEDIAGSQNSVNNNADTQPADAGNGDGYALGPESDALIDENGKPKDAETSFTNQADGGKVNEGFNHDEANGDVPREDSASLEDAEKNQKKLETVTAYKDKGSLKSKMRPYSSNSSRMVKTHPLQLMVKHERVDLLAHPLVVSLLNHKWRHLGRYFFWATLLFYVFFLALLTGYVTVTPPTLYANGTDGSITWFADGEERWVNGFANLTQTFFGTIGNWIILGLSALSLLREIIVFLIQRQHYFGFINLMECALHVLAILLVLPLGDTEYITGVVLRLDWQWQCGAAAVCLAWINLTLFIRRFSPVGIYVTMLTDVVRSFARFALILVMLVVAFALAFYMLLVNQQPFHRIEYSLAKTFAMMIGELDFNTIFHSQDYEAGDEDYFLNNVFHRGATYALVAAFIAVMAIVVVNLMIGIAVYDVQEIKRKAKLHQMATRVEMVLEVQHYLPVCIWRSVMRAKKRYYPNSGCCAGLKKGCRVLRGDTRIIKKAIKICEKRAANGGKFNERLPSQEFYTGVKSRLQTIDSRVEDVHVRTTEQESKTGGELQSLRNRFDRMERKIDALLSRKKIRSEEEKETKTNI